MTFSATFDNALIFAALAHREQVRKGTHIPYVVHPFHVSAILSRYGYGPPLTTAALLHDVLEDMPFGDASLQRHVAATFPHASWPRPADHQSFRAAVGAFMHDTFGADVMRLVIAVTENTNNGEPALAWIDRRREQLARLAGAAEDEAILKTADALHNVSTIVEDVRVGRASLEGRFKATPEQTLWYYEEVARLARERTAALPIIDALDLAVADLRHMIRPR